jgi:hypothetical protein
MKKRLEDSEALTPGKNLEVFIKEILKGKNSREINKVIEM